MLYIDRVENIAMPYHQNPSPGDDHDFGRPFLSHRYFILSLSDICMGVEKKIFKEVMHFHYMTSLYGHALAKKKPDPGVMKFTILVDPSLVIITIYLVCLIYAWE